MPKRKSGGSRTKKGCQCKSDCGTSKRCSCKKGERSCGTGCKCVASCTNRTDGASVDNNVDNTAGTMSLLDATFDVSEVKENRDPVVAGKLKTAVVGHVLRTKLGSKNNSDLS